MRNSLITIIIALLMIPLVYSTSISLHSKDYIIEGETEEASFIISTDEPFNGIVYIHYNNIQSSTTSVPIIGSKFYGIGPFTYPFEWTYRGIARGHYMISLQLKNSSGHTVAVDQRQGYVNSSNPIILTKSPTGIVTSSSTRLEVKTNKNAKCRFDTEDKKFYDLRNEFEITGEKTHTHILTNLNESNKHYFVRCIDTNRYETRNSTLIRFLVNFAPTAEIRLSKTSPLKAGIVEVTVLTSENLEQAPTLEYSFDDSPNARRIVSLTGSNSLWKGYMIITEEDDNKVGTFYFSGKDKHGTIGREITKGKSFVVDTTKPPAPKSLEARSRKDGKIDLVWHYEGEEVSHFNIYRSTSAGVDYVNYYDKTDKDEYIFTDILTNDKVTYYYRVNAVDRAGNIGYLSMEVHATAIYDSKEKAEEQQTEEPRVLPPSLVVLVNDEINRVEKLLIDLEEISLTISNENEEIISDLGLEKKLKESENELNRIKNKLESLKLSYRTETQLNNEISSIVLEMRKIQQTTPKRISLLGKSESIQILPKEYIDLAVDKLFLNPEFEGVDKERYKSQNQRIQSFIETTVVMYNLEIEYMDSSLKEKTLVSKFFTYISSEPLKDLILFEIIPREVAQSSDEIEFLKSNFEVIQDNIYKFGFTELGFSGQSLKYVVNKKVSSNSIRKTASVILVGPLQLEESLKHITGFSISDIFGSEQVFGAKGTIFIIIGLIIIGILIGYQVMISKGYTLNLDFINKLKKEKKYIRNNKTQSSFSSVNQDKVHDENNFEIITKLIDWSYEYLEQGRADKAKSLYPRISLLYKNLSKKHKKIIVERCIDLIKKIKNLDKGKG